MEWFKRTVGSALPSFGTPEVTGFPAAGKEDGGNAGGDIAIASAGGSGADKDGESHDHGVLEAGKRNAGSEASTSFHPSFFYICNEWSEATD